MVCLTADAVSIKLRGLDANVRERAQWCLDWAAHYGIPVTVTSGLRSWADQVKLRGRYEDCLQRGESVHPGNPNPACRFPANRPGDSAHNFGWAWDSWVPEQYREWWIELRKIAGFHVPANDWVHAEIPEWRQYGPQMKQTG